MGVEERGEASSRVKEKGAEKAFGAKTAGLHRGSSPDPNKEACHHQAHCLPFPPGTPPGRAYSPAVLPSFISAGPAAVFCSLSNGLVCFVEVISKPLPPSSSRSWSRPVWVLDLIQFQGVGKIWAVIISPERCSIPNRTEPCDRHWCSHTDRGAATAFCGL